jgi:hypothetical protein
MENIKFTKNIRLDLFVFDHHDIINYINNELLINRIDYELKTTNNKITDKVIQYIISTAIINLLNDYIIIPCSTIKNKPLQFNKNILNNMNNILSCNDYLLDYNRSPIKFNKLYQHIHTNNDKYNILSNGIRRHDYFIINSILQSKNEVDIKLHFIPKKYKMIYVITNNEYEKVFIYYDRLIPSILEHCQISKMTDDECRNMLITLKSYLN